MNKTLPLPEGTIIEDDESKKDGEFASFVNAPTVKLGFENVPVKTKFNPQDIRLRELEITSKTRENYYVQIRSNLYLGKKCLYIVCRDLYDAEQNLKSKEEFSQLVKDLSLSEGTVSKYLSIGKNFRLRELVSSGNFPESWTTLYYLTTLSKGDYDKVHDMITVDTTVKEIKKKLDIKPVKGLENLLLKLGKVELDKSKIYASKYDKFIERFEKFVNKFDFLNFTPEDEVANKIESYHRRKTAQLVTKRKSKELKVA